MLNMLVSPLIDEPTYSPSHSASQSSFHLLAICRVEEREKEMEGEAKKGGKVEGFLFSCNVFLVRGGKL